MAMASLKYLCCGIIIASLLLSADGNALETVEKLLKEAKAVNNTVESYLEYGVACPPTTSAEHADEEQESEELAETPKKRKARATNSSSSEDENNSDMEEDLEDEEDTATEFDGCMQKSIAFFKDDKEKIMVASPVGKALKCKDKKCVCLDDNATYNTERKLCLSSSIDKNQTCTQFVECKDFPKMVCLPSDLSGNKVCMNSALLLSKSNFVLMMFVFFSSLSAFFKNS